MIDDLAAAREKILERSIVDPMTGCRVWRLAKNKSGYGVFKILGRFSNASRAAYIAFVGPVPTGMCVCHRCDNPACVNPDHLWVGTYKDNWADCRSKGRETKGTANGKAKLNDGDVAAIRSMSANGERQEAIAAMFSIAHGTVSKIVARKLWPHVIP